MPTSIRKVVTSSFSITVAQVITILCSLVTVPLLLRTLGQQQYGLWLLLLSVTGYFGLTNLGITYSLKNKVAYLFAEGKHEEINNFISACFLFYSFLFAFLLGLMYILLHTDLFPINFLLSKDIVFVGKAELVLGIIITYYLFNIFMTGMITNVFHALQEISRLNILNAVYSVLSAIAFIVFLLFRPSLVDVAIFQGASAVVQAGILYLLLKRRFRWLKVSLVFSNLKYMSAIKMTSFYFFTGSILTTIITSIDNIVISHFIGLSSVFLYSLLFRLFLYASSPFPIATASWPLISSMYQKKEVTALGEFYAKVLRLNVLTKFPAFIFAAVFSQEIVTIWVGFQQFYGYSLVAIFLFTWMLWVWNGSNMVFINAMSMQKLIQVPLLFEATINLSVSILLVKYTSLGLVGVALGTLIGQALVAMYFIPKILSKQLPIKPFTEISRIVTPLFIPAFALLGLKILIDFTIFTDLIRYGLYIVSLVVYLVLLYSIVLKEPERLLIKEKFSQFMYLGKRIATQPVSSSFAQYRNGIKYLWGEDLTPGQPQSRGLGYGQNNKSDGQEGSQ